MDKGENKDIQRDGNETEELSSDTTSSSDEEGRDRTELPSGQFMMRPSIRDRFRPTAVKEIIHTILREELYGKIYSESEPGELTKAISQKVKRKVMGFPRYKYVVQVILGEQMGAGVRTGTRCLWDADCDNYASDVYVGVSYPAHLMALIKIMIRGS